MATKKAAAKPVELKTKNVSSEQVILDSEQSLAQKLQAAHNRLIQETCDQLGIPIPTWKRTLMTYVAAFAAGYGIGLLFGLIDVLLLSSLMSVSVALYWAVWVVGLLLAIYATLKAGQFIGNYIMSGQIDRDIVAVKDKVTGWFARKPAPALTA